MLKNVAYCLFLTTCSLSFAEKAVDHLAPGTPEVSRVRHMCLVYHGGANRVPWTAEAILPYVAHLDNQRRPTDWMFDSILLIEYIGPDGANLHHYFKNTPPPTIADWSWLADAWFRGTTGLIGLENAVANAGRVLNQPGHVLNVVITLPNPLRSLTQFGPLPGQERKLDFSKSADRQGALEWYIDLVRGRWAAAKYRHLRLVGFYWSDETIDAEDFDIVRATAAYAHTNGYNLYWIPYFGAAGLDRWRDLGIDAAMLQPNYMQPVVPPRGRLTAATRIALSAGSGIEVEFDARALDSTDARSRFWAYLDAGAHYGWMKDSPVAYYEAGGALKKLVDAGGVGRQMYDALYAFIKGTYAPVERSPVADLIARADIRANLALVSRGARITGAEPPQGRPQLQPELIIDGQTRYYDGSSGYAYFPIPGSITVELPSSGTVSLTQTHLWDRDDRYFRYRIDTSLDGQRWDAAVDKSSGEWRSWQVDRFTPRRARYVRLTGLFNSANSNFQLVQFEVYAN